MAEEVLIPSQGVQATTLVTVVSFMVLRILVVMVEVQVVVILVSVAEVVVMVAVVNLNANCVDAMAILCFVAIIGLTRISLAHSRFRTPVKDVVRIPSLHKATSLSFLRRITSLSLVVISF